MEQYGKIATKKKNALSNLEIAKRMSMDVLSLRMFLLSVSTDVLSLWMFCPHGLFVCQMFCPYGHFVSTDVLSLRMFCPTDVMSPVVLSPDVLSSDVLSLQTFCLGTGTTA